MSNEYYKEKYMKYKKKYIDLKLLENNLKQYQKGGLGQTISWVKNANFSRINDLNKVYIGIDLKIKSEKEKSEIISRTIYDKFENSLNNLLKFNDGEINCDFIDNFNSSIFIDTKNEFNIKLNEKELTFNEKWQYVQTVSTPVIVTSNSSIFFIEHKNDNSRKFVLKVFIGSEKSKSIRITDLNSIREYLSLQIIRLVDKQENFTIQPRNVIIPKDNFNKKFNYNDYNIETEFIKTNYNDKIVPLYLSTYNSNAINDLIINLILQKLNKDGIIANNFVKYHNIFISQYTTVNKGFLFDSNDTNYTYFVIMDQMNGSIDNLFIKNPQFLIQNKNLLQYMFHTLEIMCKPLKEKPYLFTHTDMKMENVFYKIFDTYNEEYILGNNDDGSIREIKLNEFKNKLIVYKIKDNGIDKYIAFYLADYDKASITYNNIRFYNEPKHINTESFLFGLLQDELMFSDIAIIEGDNKTYNISRIIGDSKISVAVKNVETEQLYMRYSMFPFYVNFDYASLLISLAIFMSTEQMNTLDQFSEKYILNYRELYQFYFTMVWGSTESEQRIKYNGDFGKMLAPFFVNKESRGIRECNFLQKYNSSVKVPIIDRIFISPNRNKLCLTMPFKGDMEKGELNVVGQGFLNVLASGLTTNLTSFTDDNIYIIYNKEKTNKLYEPYDISKIKEKCFPKNKNIQIEYTGDQIDIKDIIFVKTNKYSYQIKNKIDGIIVGKKLYNYDSFSVKNVQNIIKFQNLSSEELENPQFVTIPHEEKPLNPNLSQGSQNSNFDEEEVQDLDEFNYEEAEEEEFERVEKF